jgi:hypothetical protein
MGDLLSKAHELGLMGLFLPLAASAEVTRSISDLWEDFYKIRQAVGEICPCPIMKGLTKSMHSCAVEILMSEEEKTYMKGQAAKVRMS